MGAARRRWLFVLAWSAAAAGSWAATPSGLLHTQDHPEESPILAEYDFERPTPSGPDTFWVRDRGDSEVGLSRAFRVSGERSLHISEVPGNRDFAEFLAYFRECREGSVFVQFYLLLTDPEQRFNFGLAGPRWFLSLDQDGQAIWLQTDDGIFRHRPRAGWEQLFAPRPFAWYFVDIVYDVDRGSYDLAVFEEGLEEPVVDLRRVRGMNGHQRSAVKYFSLIGDLEDAGRFDFFVDDLVIATHPAVRQRPFVAPGRRRLFVERLALQPPRARSQDDLEDLFWRARRWLDEVHELGDLGRGVDAAGTAALDRLEVAADEAFRAGELELAETIYQTLRGDPRRRVRVLLKLSDVSHLQGDPETERLLRESIYGSLKLEDR